MSPGDQEELAYLREALSVLKQSLEREENPALQDHLREYIRDLEQRIAAKETKS